MSLAVALHPTGEPHWDSATAVLPPVLDLLLDSPEGTVLSLNVPDLPVADLGPLRHAALARGGAVQARVDEIRDGDLLWARSRCPTSRRRAPTARSCSPATRR